MIYILDIAFTLIFFQPLWFYFLPFRTSCARDSSFCEIFHRNRGEQRVPDKINNCLVDFLKFRYLVLKSWRAVVDTKTKSSNIFLGVTAYSYNIQIRTRHRL